MIQTSSGIALKRYKYSDSSFILKVYTQQFGLLSFLVRSSRTIKAKNKVVWSSPLSLIDITFRLKENASLFNAQSISPNTETHTLNLNPEKIIISSFFSEIILDTLHDGEADEGLFGFLDSFVHYYASCNSIQLLPQKFLLAYSKFLGFYPELNFSNSNRYFDLVAGKFIGFEKDEFCLDRILAKNLFAVASSTFDGLDSITLEKKDRASLLNTCLDYYSYHLDGFKRPKSLPILQQVFG